ncbi:MAG: hypothetical protein ACI8UO_003974 [Verrucomicrobiales bacterium]|jgi:hypothetical protein
MNRRSLLKSVSLGGAAPLLTPFLSHLEAAAAGETPKRVVFLVEGNGLPAEHVQPVGVPRAEMPNLRNTHISQSAEEKLIDLRLSDFELPEPLTPLARHTDRLTILQGLSGRVCGGGHSNDFGALGAYSGRAGAKDITIDAAMAKANPAIFQHVALGISRNPQPNIIYGCSASGPNQKVPIYANPDLAYKMLFGKILGGNPKAEVGTQSMLLDFMVDDIKRLERQLPYDEAQKLQQYADAFSNIASRQAKLGEIDPKKIHPKRDAVYESQVETERLDAHFEMAATALITGLTNTVTLASGAGSPHFDVTFRGLGINVDKHQIGHQQIDGAAEMAVKIRQFHMELLAKLVDTLEAVPEGGGSMMDNTLIVYLSDSAENHHSTCYEWPMLMLGDLSGRLKAGGRFINVPKYGSEGHRTTGGFYTALMHAIGAPVDSFGTLDSELEGVIEQRGPMPELWA